MCFLSIIEAFHAYTTHLNNQITGLTPRPIYAENLHKLRPRFKTFDRSRSTLRLIRCLKSGECDLAASVGVVPVGYVLFDLRCQ